MKESIFPVGFAGTVRLPDIQEAQLWQAGQVRYASLRHTGFTQLQLRYIRLRPLQLLCSERLACNTQRRMKVEHRQLCGRLDKWSVCLQINAG